MQRIGVFVCWCGSNIAGTVDVKAVSEALKNEPGVVFSTNYQYMCSQAGQNLIKDAIKQGQPKGLVHCAFKQTSGYGRQGRTWVSPYGGLYASFLLRPDVPVEQISTIALVVALAVRDAVVDAVKSR